MGITDQARAIRDALDGWAKTEGGKAFIASDPLKMWQMATLSSQSPRIIICYMGEELRGDFAVAAVLGRVDRQWTVLVTRGNVTPAERGDSLSETVQNAIPFYDLVEQARDMIRVMVGVSVEAPVDFKSIRPYTPSGLLMDAYQIEFSVAADLPQLIAKPESEIAIP